MQHDEEIMSTPVFFTAENNQDWTNEVSCLKAMLTLMLFAFNARLTGLISVSELKNN
ncbi:Hypothetical protein Asd1617_01424 [Shigella dysenteriae 1617]|uniref:Uncharacterized protein n=1 Tax=Shigella dysenteriae 1617 TaxID=754093 RepID=A0A0A6ZRM4_SHIDY|nr:Hypothetical protein Asd1617_01424 [Shigella dysenteriae 1617]